MDIPSVCPMTNRSRLNGIASTFVNSASGWPKADRVSWSKVRLAKDSGTIPVTLVAEGLRRARRRLSQLV